MLRPVPILLALAVLLTSVGLGAARGTVAQNGQIVLCTGQGVISVPDPGGADAHLCPDMALSLLAAPMPGDADLPVRGARVTSVLRPGMPGIPRGLHPSAHRARDPPVSLPA